MIKAAGTSKQTLNTLHALRAIAALSVAALHVYVREDITADSILPALMELTRIGTDLFFVASGAVLAFSTATRSHRADEAASFLYDRLTRIMPLYWFVTILILGIWMISGQRLLANLVGQPEFWSTAFLMPTGVAPALSVAWSLTNLIFFYLIFSLTILAPRKLESFILMVWAGGVIALRVTVGDQATSPVLHLMAHTGALEFIAGIAIMRLAQSGRQLSTPVLTGAAIIWLGFVAIAAGPNPDITTFMNGDFRVMTLGLAAVILVAAAISFDFAKQRQPNKILRFLGDASFGIYLGHSICIALAARIWTMLESPGPADNVIAIIAMMGLSIGFGWALHQFVELPARKITVSAKPSIMASLAGFQPRGVPAQGAAQSADR